ncbi:MAG TPA: methyltransferase, partial [Clostridiales bacterium]|nr:methyltransferase [Clostridiales bacterium]
MPITPKTHKLSPLLKYPGGKDKELGHILPNLPYDSKNYYEPFVGGGAVYFSVTAD